MLQQKPFSAASHDAELGLAIQGKFYDTIDYKELMAIIQRRAKDGRLLRLIGKWLATGAVEEDGRRIRGKKGTPQGSVLASAGRSDAHPAPRPMIWPWRLATLCTNGAKRRRRARFTWFATPTMW